MAKVKLAKKSETIALDALTEEQRDAVDEIRGDVDQVVYDISDHIANLLSCETLKDLLFNLEQARSTLDDAASELQDVLTRAEELQAEVDGT